MRVKELNSVTNIISNVLIVTVPGVLSEDRLRDLSQNVLFVAEANKIDGVIFDLSALTVIDGHEFEKIKQLVNACRVLGSESGITGLSPGMVMAIIDLNLDYSDLKAFSSIDNAIETFNGKNDVISVETEDEEFIDEEKVNLADE